jgi:hypothetical protein
MEGQASHVDRSAIWSLKVKLRTQVWNVVHTTDTGPLFVVSIFLRLSIVSYPDLLC